MPGASLRPQHWGWAVFPGKCGGDRPISSFKVDQHSLLFHCTRNLRIGITLCVESIKEKALMKLLRAL